MWGALSLQIFSGVDDCIARYPCSECFSLSDVRDGKMFHMLLQSQTSTKPRGARSRSGPPLGFLKSD